MIISSRAVPRKSASSGTANSCRRVKSKSRTMPSMIYLLNGGAGLGPAPFPGQPRAALRNAVKMLIPMGRSPAAPQSASRGLLVISSQHLLMS